MFNTPNQKEKNIAALSYLLVLFLIPLLLKKESSFCQFHAKQGLVLFVFCLVISLIGALSLIGWLIIMPLGWIVVVALSFLGLINARQGRGWPMPFFGKYVKKINF